MKLGVGGGVNRKLVVRLNRYEGNGGMENLPEMKLDKVFG